MCNYTKGVGHGQTHETPDSKYDAEHGTHKDNVGAPEQHLPTPALPKGPEKSPFKLGPTAPG